MADSNTGAGSGISVFTLFGIVFVTLKLIGVIDWSWWWVTAPFWGGLAVIAMVMVLGLFALAVAFFER